MNDSGQFKPPPIVSIIIPVLNGIRFVPRCIESIFDSPTGVRFEVVVIDQASDDGILDYLKSAVERFPDFRLIQNESNVGFTKAINQGALIAKGEYLAICNSDLVFTTGWLDRLIKPLESDPDFAIVSPVTNYVGEGPQLDLEAVDVTPETAPYYAQEIASRRGVRTVVDRLVFFCVLVRKNVFDLLGGLSEIYGLGNYEDDDFCLRARLTGYKLGVVPGAFVFHYGTRTFKEQGVSHVDWMEMNEKIFYNRVVDFSTNPPPFIKTKSQKEINISVVVRTKDRPHFLKHALSSLANQTYDKFEVILINDGGCDIDDLILRFEPHLSIQYIRNESAKGRAAAVNSGLLKVRGQYIAYLDDDDIYYPTHLESMVSAMLSEESPQVVYTNVNKALYWFDENSQQLSLVERIRFSSRPFSKDWLLVDNWIPLNSMMHLSEWIDHEGGFNEDMEIFEDWDLLIRLSRDAVFHQVPRISCEYRFRFSEGEDDSTLKMREKALSTLQELYQRYPVEEADLRLARKATQEEIKNQIGELRRIYRDEPNPVRRNYLITAKLGGFRPPDTSP
jgi:GT2 family glycosyltransferase